MKKSFIALMIAIIPFAGWSVEIGVKEKLESLGELNLIDHLEELTSLQQQHLLGQIDAIDPSYISEQRKLLSAHSTKESFEPFQNFSLAGSVDNINLGKKMVSEGRVGCLVLAGGQGTRLGFKGPKGMYPITAVQHKTLFQLLAEKVAAASRAYNRPLHLAIMTSPLNDAETRAYFIQNNYFGLSPNQVWFFSQEMLPFLDSQGRMFLESIDTLAEGPNGNGYALHRFYASGTYDQWKKLGIRYVNLVLIDNPLADPFDPELVAFQSKRNDEVTLKSIKRDDPAESIGVLITKNEKLDVVEYSEISDEERAASLPDGNLKHPCGSISLFSFSMDFISKVAQHKQMPLHKAYKKAQKLGDISGAFYAWKFEAFIFDVLKWADHVSVLIFPREKCFAPLKNAQGANSPETVHAAILRRDREILYTITGIIAPNSVFELSPDFYYPTPDLLKEWKGKAITEAIQYVDVR